MAESQKHFRKRTIVLTAFSIILLFSRCRSLETINSNWVTVPLDSHGQIEDFSKSITSHLYDNGLLVGAGNDEKYLYILFSPDIRHHARPPSRSQLTLWLAGSSGKAGRYGFIYTRPYFPEGTDDIGPGARYVSPDHKETGTGKPPANIEPLLQFFDKSTKKQIFLPIDGSNGPQIHFSSDWGDFVYAWRIPLIKETKEDFYGLAAIPGQAIGIGLLWEIKPLFDSKKPNGTPEAGIDGPPGGVGRMGGPPGGGMNRGGPGLGTDFAELPASRKIQLKIILAQK